MSKDKIIHRLSRNIALHKRKEIVTLSVKYRKRRETLIENQEAIDACFPAI
jgi:hypothetical protein